MPGPVHRRAGTAVATALRSIHRVKMVIGREEASLPVCREAITPFSGSRPPRVALPRARKRAPHGPDTCACGVRVALHSGNVAWDNSEEFIMTTSRNEPHAIIATEVQDENRLEFLPRHFGRHMLTVEQYIYSQCGNLCPSYRGGYWNYYDLSNGGCYLAPSGESYSLICEGNLFDATVSSDAAGIIVSLFTFSQLSFILETDPLGPRLGEYFHQLRDFAGHHPEAGLIYRAID